VVVALTVSGWLASSASALDLLPTSERQTEVGPGNPTQLGRLWAYWGGLEVERQDENNPATLERVRWGSYRATCVSIAPAGFPPDKADDRMSCTVVMAARGVLGGTLVAEGLVKMPRAATGQSPPGFFMQAHECSSARRLPPPNCVPRKLAIVGATGRLYKNLGGYVVSLKVAGRIRIVAPPP
jgi:hypothetical protein